jgi:hypothetical protein
MAFGPCDLMGAMLLSYYLRITSGLILIRTLAMNRDGRIHELQRITSRRRSGAANVIACIGTAYCQAICTVASNSAPGLSQASGILCNRLGCSWV